MKQAIINKAKAIQDAQAKNAEIGVAEATARVALINTRKDSAITVIDAKSKAEAIRVTQDQLKQSPAYLELRRIEAWEKGGSQVPTTVLGGNSSYIFSPNK